MSNLTIAEQIENLKLQIHNLELMIEEVSTEQVEARLASKLNMDDTFTSVAEKVASYKPEPLDLNLDIDVEKISVSSEDVQKVISTIYKLD